MRTHRSTTTNSGTVMIEAEALSTPAEYPNYCVTIPPNGQRCEFTGLGHAKLYQILGAEGVARPKVRVANLRMPGTARTNVVPRGRHAAMAGRIGSKNQKHCHCGQFDKLSYDNLSQSCCW